MIEFPAPGYDAKDPLASRKKIAVQYSSINGNGFGGYGEIVFGTKGTLILEQEQEAMLSPNGLGTARPRFPAARPAGRRWTPRPAALRPGQHEQGFRRRAGDGHAGQRPGRSNGVSRGYAEELEHWAWCIRNPAPENQPRCHPKVALGDAVIALTTNMAAREGRRIEFKEEWFDPDSDETPENIKPDVRRYDDT